MALYTRFFEAGRLAIGRYGDVFHKPVVIVDIVTLNRVIVEGPGVPRQLCTIKRLDLTDYKIDIKRGASSKEIIEALKKDDVISKWEQTKEGRTHTKYTRLRQLNDFEMFKYNEARKFINKAIREQK